MAYTTLVSAAILAEHLHRKDWVIFDCRFNLQDNRNGKAYRFGHIPGAFYADLDLDLSSPTQTYGGRHPLPNFSVLAQKLGVWGVNNHSQVVVYDDTCGVFAGRMWWLLQTMGHSRVAVLDGGLRYWQALELPLVTTLPKLPGGQFRDYLDTGRWLNAREVEDGLASRRITLIDARDTERFQGLREPIDAVAGHVPKALSRPCRSNLDQRGLFLPPDQLRRQFNDLTGSTASSQVVHMCGSGVTACHNLLAMELAGLSGSKLYAGSWSDWITNRNRAIHTGKN